MEQSHELLFRAAQLRQRLSATDLAGTSAEPRLGRSGGAGLIGGGFGGDWERLLQGTDVLLSFGGQADASDPSGAGGPRWTVWGQGDLQTFRGAETEHEGYDGDLRTGYLGLDARLGEKWLVGAAVARSGGGGDWQVGSSSGRLTTALTVVHPYLRWGDRDTSVWALAGIGLGAAENVRTLTGRRGTSPLGLGLGLVEGRRRLATTGGGLAVDLRGEASWARLRTGDGEETVDGLEAGVRRVRTGVEVTLALAGPGGLRVAPFGAVSTRHDGGAGQTGVGLELAGGVRLTGGRVRIEAQGRTLALHTATDYEEQGVSVTASVGAGQYEPGLTASIRPRWGDPGYGAESLWQDQLQSYTYGAERDDAAVDARVGYGLRLPGGRLLTPFGGYGQMGTGRRVQLGATSGCSASSAATSMARCRSSSWASATTGREAEPIIASVCSGLSIWAHDSAAGVTAGEVVDAEVCGPHRMEDLDLVCLNLSFQSVPPSPPRFRYVLRELFLRVFCHLEQEAWYEVRPVSGTPWYVWVLRDRADEVILSCGDGHHRSPASAAAEAERLFD